MSDIINLNLSELVSNIKDKKISSNEVTSAYIERSKKSKHLNSYNEETFDEASKKSKEFDSKPDFNKKMRKLCQDWIADGGGDNSGCCWMW